MAELYKYILDWATIIGILSLIILALGGVIWSVRSMNTTRFPGLSGDLATSYCWHLLLPWVLDWLRRRGPGKRSYHLGSLSILVIHSLIWVSGVVCLNLIVIYDNYDVLSGQKPLHPTMSNPQGINSTLMLVLLGPLVANIIWWAVSVLSIFRFLGEPPHSSNWLSGTSPPPTYSTSLKATILLMVTIWLVVTFNIEATTILAGRLRLTFTLAAIPYGVVLGFWYFSHLRIRKRYEETLMEVQEIPQVLEPVYLRPFAYSIFGMIVTLWSLGLFVSIS